MYLLKIEERTLEMFVNSVRYILKEKNVHFHLKSHPLPEYTLYESLWQPRNNINKSQSRNFYRLDQIENLDLKNCGDAEQWFLYNNFNR